MVFIKFNFKDGKELCLNEHSLSDHQETKETIYDTEEYYVNKGFNDSTSSKEDFSYKVIHKRFAQLGLHNLEYYNVLSKVQLNMFG